jgi:hypothetical protein
VRIFVIHSTGTLLVFHSNAVPRVGDTLSMTGKRHDCRTVVRVDWSVYVASEADKFSATGVGAVDGVRVYVE